MMNTGPVRPSGTVDFRFVVSGSNYDTASTATVNDGNDHSVFEAASADIASSTSTASTRPRSPIRSPPIPRPAYGFTNYPPSGAYPLLGPIGGIALWLGGSPFAQNLIASIDTCAKTGVCAAPVTGCIPTSPAPLWCETFTSGSLGRRRAVRAPAINTPYLDTSNDMSSIPRGGGIVHKERACNAGKTLSGLSPSVGDFVIAGPGAIADLQRHPRSRGVPVRPSRSRSGPAERNGRFWRHLQAAAARLQGQHAGQQRVDQRDHLRAIGRDVPAGTTRLDGHRRHHRRQHLRRGPIGGGDYSVNVSQTSKPDDADHRLALGAVRDGTGIFNTISCADSNAAGIGTTGTTANALRLFGQSLQEGFVTGCIYFSQPGSHGWATSGIQIVQINSSGSNTNGVMMAAYNPSGGNVAPTYGTLSGSGIGNCAMSPSSISVLYNNWYRFVLAWRSAADSSGYTKFYLGNLVIPAASAFGNNQASPCNMPSTLNAVALEAEATADSPTAEYYVGEVAAYAGPYSAGQSPNVALIQ